MTSTPAPTEQEKTNNLLNLLRSKSNVGGSVGPMANLQNIGRTPSGSLEETARQAQSDSQSKPLLAADLVASLQRSKPAHESTAPRGATGGAEKKEDWGPPSHDSKQFLLNLLKKPSASNASSAASKPADSSRAELSLDQLVPASSTTASEAPVAQREPTPVRQFGSPVANEVPFEAPQPKKPTKFNYVNPFEQLHSSSPLNRTPNPEVSDAQPKKFEILKHDRDISSSLNGETSLAPQPKSRKIDGLESPSQVQTSADKGQSVSEALEDVGEKVDKQVEEALKQVDIKEERLTEPSSNTRADLDSTEIKKEPGVDDTVDSSWESAEDEEAEKEEREYLVPVFNFPMRAFATIAVKDLPGTQSVRQESLSFIARLKKDFDQIDRNLVTSSKTLIVYAPVPTKKVHHPGLRIIQQDFGQHKHIFTATPERLFNVQICNSSVPGNDTETILGTGVNGTIFWTSLSKSRGELFADDDVEAQGFIMPPVTTAEEQTSGSPVKTRAKVSSRHPDYFGVARGKMIHIISPDVVKDRAYLDPKTKMVKSEKYLAEHGLRIMTGKAGKDFCFSEDDSVIASLDKSGKIKFWDIKELITRASDITGGKHEAIELREPLWSLTAAASGSKPEEKPSVSSIMFLDKEKPTLKGAPLRYMLIGFKQNHILQLWDLGLGKPVQELQLPHEKDSDGICSIQYHARTGVIAIGHPTRNSIYFVHLSAPMYRLPNMDQARYISAVARGDPNLPNTSSTAIMSGIRELSFAKIGELRSLDMLRTLPDHAQDVDTEDAPLFELYAMHSKGVVSISVKKRDVGWDKDNKIIKTIEALDVGAIEVSNLRPVERSTTSSEQTTVTDMPSKSSVKSAGSKKQEATKTAPAPSVKSDVVKRGSAVSPVKDASGSTAPASGSKQVFEATLPAQPPSHAAKPSPMATSSYAVAARGVEPPHREPQATHAPETSRPEATSEAPVSAPRVSSDADLQAMLGKQFENLYQRIDSDKRVVDAAGSAKQEAMLRLISSTLAENVEQSLHRIVGGSIEKEVLPAISNVTSQVVEKKLADVLPQQINTNVTREVRAALPQAMQQALKDAQVHRLISDQVATKIQQQVSQLLQKSLPDMAMQATQKMVADLDKTTKAQMRELETRRVHDIVKIDQLTDLVRGLSSTVARMSESQAAFQEQILKLQEENASMRGGENVAKEAPVDETDHQSDAEDKEVAKITRLLKDGQFDAATLEVRFPPTFNSSPLCTC